ncbi:MAG: EAL domain-containing protein [Treponema sp.]|nr:EAL domain-containing protein [Treponema sp.]
MVVLLEMAKIYYFDYCAIILQLFLILAVLYRRLTSGRSSKIFFILTIIVLVNSILDLGMEIASADPNRTPTILLLTNILTYGYLLVHSSINLVYILLIFSLTRTGFRLKKIVVQGFLIVPLLFLYVTILTNPIHHAVFSITREYGYQRCSWFPLLYVFSILYALVGMGYLFSCRFIDRSKWFSLFAMYPLALIATVIQFLYPQFLVEMFADTMVLLVLFNIVLRPEEMMDPQLGVLNWNSYQAELKKIHATKQSVQICIVRFMNCYEVRSSMEEDQYVGYLRKIISHIQSVLRDTGQKYDLYYEQSGCFYLVFPDLDFNQSEAVPTAVRDFFIRAKDLIEYGIRFVPKISTLNYPQDISDFNSLIHFGRTFPSLMPPDEIYSSAADIVKTKNFKIANSMDDILTRAIKNNALEVYYQPIYSVREKRFVSAEALIRLKDPEYGFVSPGIFIPAAEKNGMILAIGDFVLREVFKFIAEEDLDLLGLSYIEINLSVSQCIKRDLPEKIFRLQEEFNIKPEKVNFEITETAYENSKDVMADNLRQLSAAGYKISLDDYGTGYSNMQRVLKIPLQIIKIDKSLVDYMNSGKGKSIVKNTIRMMQDIGLELVVEGVETKEILDYLIQMNADYIQGFYFSKPLPKKEFLEFINICRHYSNLPSSGEDAQFE